MKKLLSCLFFLFAACAFGQNGPQIPLSGSIGVPGSSPTLCSSSVVLSSDANYTLTANQYACNTVTVTSSVALTATRTITAPQTYGQQFTFTNATTGGQALIISGGSGSTVTVPNGTSIIVNDVQGTGYVQTSASAGASLAYPGLIYATSATSSRLAAYLDFAPQMFDSQGNLQLDSYRTSPFNTAEVQTTIVAGRNVGAQLGSGWSGTTYSPVNGNLIFGDSNLASTTTATSMSVFGYQCMPNWTGISEPNGSGDPTNGNSECFGAQAGYGAKYGYEDFFAGQKAAEYNGQYPGSEGFFADSIINGMHGDNWDQTFDLVAMGVDQTRGLLTPEAAYNDLIFGASTLSCNTAGCIPSGTVEVNQSDVIMAPKSYPFNTDDLFTAGYGSGTLVSPTSPIGAVAAVQITTQGAYTGACPTITFSAPPSGTTAASTLVCSYNPSTQQWIPAYATYPGGTGYVWSDTASLSTSSNVITLSAADSRIAVGDIVFEPTPFINIYKDLGAVLTVTAVSGTSVTLSGTPIHANTAATLDFGQAPTITVTCSGSCTGGSGLVASAYLTGEGYNASALAGYNCGTNVSASGGVNVCYGSGNIINQATNTIAVGINNGTNVATGNNHVIDFGVGNQGVNGGTGGDANDSYDIFEGWSNQCNGCSDSYLGGNYWYLASSSAPVTNFWGWAFGGQRTPLGSYLMQFGPRIVTDSAGDMEANWLGTDWGSTISAASTISPPSTWFGLGGTGTVTTITVPDIFPTATTPANYPFMGCIHMLTGQGIVFATGGNIANTITTGNGDIVAGCYEPQNNLWHLSDMGQITGGVLGSVPYQNSPGQTVLLAPPTTAGHTYVEAEQPTGASVAPSWLDLATYLSSYAPLASPTFTGTPTAPTAATGTNTTQLATTAFTNSAILAATKTMSFVWGDDGNTTPITTSNTVYGFWENMYSAPITVTEVDCYSNDGTATVTIGYGTGSNSNVGTIVTGTACANTGTKNTGLAVSVPAGDVLNFVPTGGSSARVSVMISFHQ